jgi:hypothetical protein
VGGFCWQQVGLDRVGTAGADNAADGGFHWVAVGSDLSATLDTTGANLFGSRPTSVTALATA